jgi:hypothetical protein
MLRTDASDSHGKFKELCALAQCQALSMDEQGELDVHLKVCESCRVIYEEYALIGEEGMPLLAADNDLAEEVRTWDNGSVRENLLTAIREPRRVVPIKSEAGGATSKMMATVSRKAAAIGALAACALVILTLGAYRMGERKSVAALQPPPSIPQNRQAPLAEKSIAESRTVSAGVFAAQTARLGDLEKQIANEREELTRLRASSASAGERVNELQAVESQKTADLQRLGDERNQFAAQLAAKETAYEALQADYARLRAEHSQSLVRMASLESEATDLQAANRDQEGRLQDEDQYLTSDRDIRELMGARKLYIADVFDVDSVSHTRKPFGRVFYTQNKSLVFYAFDLDHQPGVKNASVFQVWGQRDGEASDAPPAMNLGILYMDSETNRRWVLRSDDPKQLAEIDAVFVTVEPHGGSQKPTGKPLLYALLRKEANHP